MALEPLNRLADEYVEENGITEDARLAIEEFKTRLKETFGLSDPQERVDHINGLQLILQYKIDMDGSGHKVPCDCVCQIISRGVFRTKHQVEGRLYVGKNLISLFPLYVDKGRMVSKNIGVLGISMKRYGYLLREELLYWQHAQKKSLETNTPLLSNKEETSPTQGQEQLQTDRPEI